MRRLSRGVAFFSVSFSFLFFAQSIQKPPVEFGDADHFGGYSTEHILVRLNSELAQSRLESSLCAIDQGAIDFASSIWQVQAVEPILRTQELNFSSVENSKLDRTFRFKVPKGTDTRSMAASFSSLPGVELAELDGIGGVGYAIATNQRVPNDTRSPELWGMRNTGQLGGTPGADAGATFAWTRHTGSDSVLIAVADTGIEDHHPELAGRVIRGWNVFNNNDDTTDRNGHGTHVAGTIGAVGNNQFGVVGMNWDSRILAMKCLGDDGFGNESHLAAAIRYATDHGARIVSMSLQFFVGSATLGDATKYAADHGVLLIAAAGNTHARNVAYPARYPNVLAVAAFNRFDQIADFSSWGPAVDVAAPGVDVLSLTCPPPDQPPPGLTEPDYNRYLVLSGTSMATPHVSGLAALLWSANPRLTALEITEILKSTAIDRGDSGWDEHWGWGRVHAGRAMDAALSVGIAHQATEISRD